MTTHSCVDCGVSLETRVEQAVYCYECADVRYHAANARAAKRALALHPDEVHARNNTALRRYRGRLRDARTAAKERE